LSGRASKQFCLRPESKPRSMLRSNNEWPSKNTSIFCENLEQNIRDSGTIPNFQKFRKIRRQPVWFFVL